MAAEVGIGQVPRHAVEALLRGRRQRANDLTGGVANAEHDVRLRLAALPLEFVEADEWSVLPLLLEFFLRLASGVFEGLQPLAQMVGEDGAEGWVLGNEVAAALGRLPTPSERAPLEVPRSGSHREEDGFLLEGLLAHLAEGRVIIENVEAAAEGCAHEIVLAALDREVAEGDGREATGELEPLVATVDGEEDAEFGAGKEQFLLDVVLDQAPDQQAIRKIARK